MPGLFGILALDNAPLPAESAALLDAMAQRLRKLSDERVDFFRDESRGVHLARIGLPHVHPAPWPREKESPSTFVAGSLHGPLPTRDSLEAVQALRGFFAVVVHGPERTFLAVDRHASLPVFFTQVDGVLLFAPEVDALFCHPRVPRLENPGAIANFITSGFLVQDQTLVRGIQRLRGGHALVLERGKLQTQRYWHYHPGARSGTKSRRELEETLGDLVEASVARNLDNPEKTVLFLSGGFDSRAILGGARKALRDNLCRLQTVSWGKDRGSNDSDVAVAQTLTAALGMPHHFIQRQTDDYAGRFREVNALVSTQSEIAAFHPHEYTIMKELRSRGFERVLRGDECFGWSYHVLNPSGALGVVGVHRLRDAVNGQEFFRAEKHSELLAAGDQAIDSVLGEVQGMSADDAKDYFYFAHRLQSYLNSASYYKRCLFDQRNVLLDETMFDFLEMVPARMRYDKNLFCSAMRRRFPDLYRVPIAGKHNLENWQDLLGKDSTVRTFALQELSDLESGIWNWFDRSACLLFLETVSGVGHSKRQGGFKPFLVDMFLKLPRWMQRPVQSWRSTRPAFRLNPTHLILRILTLKDWHDRQITQRRTP